MKVKSFNHIGKDERGMTQDFSLPRKQQDFVYITRRKNTVSGNTYHAGKNPGTNPKTFLLLSGEIEFSYRHVDSSLISTIQVKSPASIEVQPNTVHAVKTLTDIAMLECNSILDIQQDVVKKPVVEVD